MDISTLEVALEREKNYLEKIIQVVKNGGEQFRPPYQRQALSISEHLLMISRNLDKLSQQNGGIK